MVDVAKLARLDLLKKLSTLAIPFNVAVFMMRCYTCSCTLSKTLHPLTDGTSINFHAIFNHLINSFHINEKDIAMNALKM